MNKFDEIGPQIDSQNREVQALLDNLEEFDPT